MTFDANNACVFRKTKEMFGGLSNMAGGFPLNVNGIVIRTSEALYQALRFPAEPEVQRVILADPSPMGAKMKARKHTGRTRPDWDLRHVQIMEWCLRVKLAQNFATFGGLLRSTGHRVIVEESHRDRFWGAVRDKLHADILEGENKLGLLLMGLRDRHLLNPREPDQLVVEPLDIPDFILNGVPVQEIDERRRFSGLVE